MSGILLLYAVPYLLFSYMRPIIGMPPWPTRVGSVFTTSQEELLFALSPNKRDEYHLLAKQITSAACSRVGVALHWDDLEYTLWWELGAPESGTQLRYVEARSPTDKLIEPDYQPCAILCTTCVDLSAFHGLPLFTDAGHIKLFMDSPTGAGSEISRTPR
jgi:hypothetical protein